MKENHMMVICYFASVNLSQVASIFSIVVSVFVGFHYYRKHLTIVRKRFNGNWYKYIKDTFNK